MSKMPYYRLTLRQQNTDAWETIYRTGSDSTLVLLNKLLTEAEIHAGDLAEQILLDQKTNDGFTIFNSLQGIYAVKVEEVSLPEIDSLPKDGKEETETWLTPKR